MLAEKLRAKGIKVTADFKINKKDKAIATKIIVTADDEAYKVNLSISGASGDNSDDMALRDDVWAEISSATGIEFEHDFEGEAYDTGGSTNDPEAFEKMKKFKQEADAGSIGKYYLDEGDTSISVQEDSADIDISFDYEDEDDEDDEDEDD